MLLHLDSAANRDADSVSRALTRSFADAWLARHGGPHRYRDLTLDPVPPIDHAYCALGRRLERAGLRALEHVGAAARGVAETRTWAATLPLLEELTAARLVLIGAPMYNYSVPAALKAWMDRVTFPGTQPLRDTDVVMVCPRGGGYGSGRRDHQVPLLRTWCTRLGARPDHLHVVTIEHTMAAVAPHLAQHRADADRLLADARAHLDALVQCVWKPMPPANSYECTASDAHAYSAPAASRPHIRPA